ncbi:MAG: hypothetical protein H0U77_11320 [Nocardioidaceae bacterium]|nr:hypothetical protein [Nocardioidaceae bacterium]
MRCYDDPVEVRTGVVDGVEAPAQFVWRDRLWQVRAVAGHWVETAPWWHQPAVQGLLGLHDGPLDEPTHCLGGSTGEPARAGSVGSVASLVTDHEVWRVQAARGRLGAYGGFELVRDGETGRWRLTGCED